MREQAGRDFADAAPVLLINEVLGDRQLRALYRTATHYISMSHGEGWDMPMMEAAAARVIADVIASGRRRPPPMRRMLTEFTWERASRRLLGLPAGP
jgi:hypothetical protein